MHLILNREQYMHNIMSHVQGKGHPPAFLFEPPDPGAPSPSMQPQ